MAELSDFLTPTQRKIAQRNWDIVAQYNDLYSDPHRYPIGQIYEKLSSNFSITAAQCRNIVREFKDKIPQPK